MFGVRRRESNVWCKAESKGERAMFGVRRRESNVWCKAESEGDRAMFGVRWRAREREQSFV